MSNSSHTPSQARYHPALDGIRALSIVAVFVDHVSYGYYEGGMLGVDVFFTLSGFLITGVLLTDLRDHGRIDFRSFYLRRVRRLLPALVATLLLSWAFWSITSANTPFGPAAAASVFYYANWKACFAPASMGALSQMWSLSVEEQFYLAWPLSLTALVAWLKARPQPTFEVAALATLLLAAGAAVSRAVLFFRGSPIGNYYSTLSRIDVILIGCSCALALQGAWLKRVFDGRAGAWLAWLGGGAILSASFFVRQQSPWLYLGGLSLIGMCAACVIAHVTTASSSLMTRMLSVNALVEIGRRSYGIYLYHAIVTLLLERLRVRHSFVNLLSVLALNVTITLAVAWTSYRFIESSFLKRRVHAAGRQFAGSFSAV